MSMGMAEDGATHLDGRGTDDDLLGKVVRQSTMDMGSRQIVRSNTISWQFIWRT